MRVAVLILGLIAGLLMFLQTLIVYAGSSVAEQENMQGAAVVGVLMALFWLIACAFVIPLPIVSVVLFTLAGLLGFMASGDFPDLGWWGGISLVLAVLSLLGWMGKRKERRLFKVEREQQEARDARLEALLQQQAQTTTASTVCPSCSRANPAGTRFCGNCGTALVAA